MIITREKGMRMWGGGSGSTSASGVNGGGGFSLAVTEGEGTGNAYTDFTYESGILTLNKGSEFVTVDFFNKLFTAYDANGNVIAPNNTTPTLDNIKFKAGAWTEQYLSALGQNSSGGGGGGGIELSDVWQSLKTNTDDYANQKINAAHIPDLSGTYATKTWVNQQGFVTSSGVTSVATGTGLTGGTITSTGTISINSTYQTYISNGNTAYGYFNSGGVAKVAAKLNTGSTTYSIWGQTYWQNGVPNSVSNTYMSGVTNIDSLLYFDTTNSRVGIGTSSPSYKLDVNGDVRSTFYRTTNADGSFGALNSRGSIFCYLDSSLTGGFSTGMYAIDSSGTTLGSAAGIYGDSNGIIRYYFGGTYNSPLMSILPSGNVGIGTTSPSYKLHVNGYTSTTRLYLSSSVYLEYDSSNSGVHLVGAGFYSDSYVSALGSNSSGGGSGTFDEEAMWTALGTTITAKVIATSHIPNLSWSKITNKPTTLSGYGITDAYTKTQVDNALGGYLTRKAYSLDGKSAVRITFNSVNGGIISARVTKQSGSLVLIGNGYGDGGTTRNNWVQISESTSYFSWCIPTATGIEKSVEIYNNDTTTASIVVASFDTNVTFTELSALSTTASTVKVAYASSLDDYLPLSGGTLTGSLKVATGYGISDATGNGLLVFKPATTWGGISSNQWGVGAGDVQGVIRSGNYNLLHYNSGTGTSSTILDSNNTNVVNGVGYINGTAITAISGNAGTATTLATSRSIWGQSFNGSAAVDGDLFLLSGAEGANINTASAKLKFNSLYADGTNIYRSPYIQALGGSSYGRKRLGFFQSNATNYTDDFVEAMSILPTGNVGIGNTSPAYKLDVSGQGHFSHSTYDVLQLTRTGGAYSTGIAFNNGSDGLLGGLMVQGSATSYSDDYNGVGTLRFKPVGGSSDFAVMHNGLTKFITATESGRYAELQNSGWLIHHITVNDAFSVAYCTYDSSGNNIGGICGCFGQNQTITNYFIGGTWNAPLVRIVRSNGNMGIGLGNTNPSYKLHVSGAIYGTGEITAASDERKKNIISNTKFNVKDIASARSIIYEWNDDRDKDNEKKTHGGSIAQDWLGKADSFLSQDNDGWYSINYGALALCSAITIAKEVVKHEDRIAILEKENAKLKARVAELEERRIA